MSSSALDALRAMERLVGLAVALGALELLHCRHALRDDAVFAWPSLRRDYAHLPRLVQRALDGLLGYRPFLALLGGELAVALTLCWTTHALLAPLLLLLSLLIGLRFRGTYNGGSDYMIVAVLLALSLARLFGSSMAQLTALGYVAAQLVLSYFVSGIAKLAQPAWRRGTVLAQLLRAPQYAAPTWIPVLLTRHPRLARITGWTVLAFECSFPAALFDRRACIAWLAVAVVFHFVNALVFGLNRFLWAWAAAFPALLFWSGRAG